MKTGRWSGKPDRHEAQIMVVLCLTWILLMVAAPKWIASISRKPWRTVIALIWLGIVVAGCSGTGNPLTSRPAGGADMPPGDHDNPEVTDSRFNRLSAAEARVILRKGTELPFVGEYTAL